MREKAQANDGSDPKSEGELEVSEFVVVVVGLGCMAIIFATGGLLGWLVRGLVGF
jgi:hypothetical protein